MAQYTKPNLRVRAEEERLQELRRFQKNKVLFNRERAMRQLRDARAQADALEQYLANLNSSYRRAADSERHRERIQSMADSTFRGRMPLEEVLRFYPTSYDRLRKAVT